MIVKKEPLHRHLSRIYCNGLVPSAILGEQYGTVAQSTAQNLIVVAPDFEGLEPLPRPLAVADLGTFLCVIAYGTDETVDFDWAPGSDRLIFQTSDQGSLTYRTEEPEPIPDALSEEDLDLILEHVPSADDSAFLTRDVVERVISWCRLLRPSLVGLQVEPHGSQFVVCDKKGNLGEIPYPDLWSEEPYWIFLPWRVLTAVLQQIDDFTGARFQPAASGSAVTVRNGPYLYVIPASVSDAENDLRHGVRRQARLAAHHDALRGGEGVTEEHDGLAVGSGLGQEGA